MVKIQNNSKKELKVLAEKETLKKNCLIFILFTYF